jgi:hypothetical protein
MATTPAVLLYVHPRGFRDDQIVRINNAALAILSSGSLSLDAIDPNNIIVKFSDVINQLPYFEAKPLDYVQAIKVDMRERPIMSPRFEAAAVIPITGPILIDGSLAITQGQILTYYTSVPIGGVYTARSFQGEELVLIYSHKDVPPL